MHVFKLWPPTLKWDPLTTYMYKWHCSYLRQYGTCTCTCIQCICDEMFDCWLQGDSPETWHTEEFRMFEGGSLWKPPPLKNLRGKVIPPITEIVKKGRLSSQYVIVGGVVVDLCSHHGSRGKEQGCHTFSGDITNLGWLEVQPPKPITMKLQSYYVHVEFIIH